MQLVSVAVLVLLAPVPPTAAPDFPKATWTVEGKTYRYAKEGLPDGVKVVLEFLGSCHHETAPATGFGYAEDAWTTARSGEHFHLMLGKAQTVRVMNEPVKVTEVVFAAGAIWVRSGDSIRRFAKYEHLKVQAFDDWRRKAAKAEQR